MVPALGERERTAFQQKHVGKKGITLAKEDSRRGYTIRRGHRLWGDFWSAGGLLLLLLIGTGAFGQEVLNATVSPYGVCRVLLHNLSKDSIDLTRATLTESGDAAVQLHWIVAEPTRLRPGEDAALSFLPKSSDVSHEYSLSVGDHRLPFSCNPPPLTATYCVYVEEKRQIYCYIANTSDESLYVTDASVGGRPIGLDSPVALEARQKSLLHGPWETNKYQCAVPPVVVRLMTTDGRRHCLFGRLFSPGHTLSFQRQAVKDTVECVSHSFENEEAAAQSAILAGHEAVVFGPRTMRCCNVDLANKAQDHFGQLTDRLHIEPQLTFADAYHSGNYGSVFRQAFDRVKQATEPGMFYVQIYTDDIHSAGSPLYGLSKIRTTIYLGLACGAKGIELRPGLRKNIPFEYRKGIDHIGRELELLYPLLALSEPVAWGHLDEQAWCSIDTLLCADLGVICILLPKETNARSNSGVPTSIEITPVAMELESEAFEVGGQSKVLHFQREEKVWRSTTNMSSEAHVFLLMAARQTRQE